MDRPSAPATQAGALDRLPRAISVVSASADGTPHAATIDSFTVVSTEPALVMVSLTRGSRMLDVIERAQSFVVSVLAVDQEHLARRFASRNRGLGAAQFDGVEVSAGYWTKALLLRGAVAWFECEVHSQVVAGDHVIVMGSLLESSVGRGDKPALLRQDRSYRALHV
jgi:flavin reductase